MLRRSCIIYWRCWFRIACIALPRQPPQLNLCRCDKFQSTPTILSPIVIIFFFLLLPSLDLSCSGLFLPFYTSNLRCSCIWSTRVLAVPIVYLLYKITQQQTSYSFLSNLAGPVCLLLITVYQQVCAWHFVSLLSSRQQRKIADLVALDSLHSVHYLLTPSNDMNCLR